MHDNQQTVCRRQHFHPFYMQSNVDPGKEDTQDKRAGMRGMKWA